MIPEKNHSPVCSLDELRSIQILDGIDQSRLENLREHLNLTEYQEGEVILRQGEATEALYFLLQGQVAVTLKDELGKQHTLAELDAGETFGERALLTGEPRTADVIACSPVRSLELSQDDFNAMLLHCPEIHANLCVKLARQLGNWAIRHQQDERENREILANLIGWQLLPEFEAFPGSTPAVQELNRRLKRLGRSIDHVLIVGERGTWKDLVARLIHFHQTDASRAVLFLDCATPPPVLRDHGAKKQSVDDGLVLKIAQESALFGHEPDSTIYARGTRRGMLELAEGGDLILRNIDRLALPVQKMLTTFLQKGSYRRRGEQQERQGRVRLLATSSTPLEEEVAAGRFDFTLFSCLSSETVHLTPLRERKKDIPVIARRLLRDLNRKHHKRVRRLSQEAQNLLVDHDWPLNGTELYQVLSRAVAVCDGLEISAEQIFLHGQVNGVGRINLLNHPAVDRLVRRPSFPGILRWLTVPLLLILIALTLWGPEFDNTANLLVWIAWWPLLLLGAAVTARSWCSCCPLEALSALLPKRKQRQEGSPAWLRDWGPPLSMAGLTMILLIEQASGMFAWARATGLLLTSLLIATLTTDLIFGQRSWCKYLCPLGRVISLVSKISLTEMYSNATVCQSRCKVDDCIKEKACPMGLHPTGINTSDHCVLCFSCVRNCPHHAMHFDLRNPADGILQRPRRRFSEALFAVTLTGAVLVSKLTPWLTGRTPEVFVSTPWSHNEVLLAVSLVGVYAVIAMLSSIGSQGRRWMATFTVCGQAYLPLAFAGLFAIYFVALIEGGENFLPMAIISLGLEQWLEPASFSVELGTLHFFTPLLLIAGTTFSWFLLSGLNRQYSLNRVGRIGHRTLMLLTCIGFLVVM
jgi:transcriptional regulator with AAA-type ATPase domain/ferredoxin